MITIGDDTIAAIATPPGPGGIGIIRVSGPEAFALVARIFRRPGKNGHQDSFPPTHQLTYGHIIIPESGEVLDEVLVAFMQAPHTYTREDVVEINCHGGPLLLQRVLELVLAQGARQANPGEMTLRAFLNGRIDLAQAEAVMDLIQARTDTALRLAARQLQGRISAEIQQARTAIMNVLARIEASIDFPEEEVPEPKAAELEPAIADACAQVSALLAGADRGRIYREGIHAVIVGRPNVGKSSLLNALLGMDRAIVTPIAGTTRDTIEELANIRGIPIYLTDTAGITQTSDPVEAIGVERSRQAIASGDLVLLMFDGSEELSCADIAICDELAAQGYGATSRPLIIVINKSDLPARLKPDPIVSRWPQAPLIHTSLLTRTGLDVLEEELVLLTAGSELGSETALVTSARHRAALGRAREHLDAAVVTLAQGLPLDFVAVDLHAAVDALGEITGETATEELLETIFHEFCIGK
jgi:tRNA modification GTPase